MSAGTLARPPTLTTTRRTWAVVVRERERGIFKKVLFPIVKAYPDQGFDVVHVVLSLERVFPLVERHETATCVKQKRDKKKQYTSQDDIKDFPLMMVVVTSERVFCPMLSDPKRGEERKRGE